MSKKLSAAMLSIVVNSSLLIAKVIAAYITGSIGILAESAHSLFDLLASVLAYLGIRKAQEPSDVTHSYGHEKFENLSSLLQTILIAITALIIMSEAYGKFVNPAPLEYWEVGIILMLVSIPVAHLTSRYLHNVAHKEGSSALEADAAHFNTDVLSSISVLTGLILARFGYAFGDPLSAFIVSLIMLYISAQLGFKSFKVFMDFAPDQKIMERIKSVLISEKRKKHITHFRKLRARITGSKIWVDVHILFPSNITVSRAHETAHEVKRKIIRKVPNVKEVNMHVEPD